MRNKRKGIAAIGKIRYQIAKGSSINLDELNLLAFQELPYLCKCGYERDANGKQFLVFYASNESSIENMIVHADKLFIKKIMIAIYELFTMIHNNQFALGNVSPELRWIFYDASGLRFSYFPLKDYRPITEKQFVLRILRQMKNAPQCRETIKIINSIGEHEISAWLFALLEDERKKCGESEAEEGGDTTLLSSSGRADTSDRQMAANNSPKLIMQQDFSQKESPFEGNEDDTTLLSPSGYTNTTARQTGTYHNPETLELAMQQDFPQEEALPEENEEGDTTLLTRDKVGETNAQHDTSVRGVTLLRCGTGERITLCGNRIVLGKESGSGCYAIKDNKSVSNRHAAVTLENGTCYILDMYSTNGSFLEGVRIPCGEKTELFNGALFALGTEFFQVFIEE